MLHRSAGDPLMDGGSKRSRLLSLHDQAVELAYPIDLELMVHTLFGEVDCGNVPPNRRLTVSIASDGRFSIHGGAVDRSGLSTADLPNALMEDVLWALIAHAHSAVALHSGAVSYDGTAILCAGPTGSGKSSLVAWLVSKGFHYLTDELVMLDRGQVDCHQVLGFARGLVIKGDAGDKDEIAALAQSAEAPAIDAGANRIVRAPAACDGHTARPCGLIMFPHFSAGSELSIVPLSPARAAMLLMACNLNARNLPDGGFAAVAALARRAGSFEIRYGAFSQLDGVADVLARVALDSGLDAAALSRLLAGLQPQAAAAVFRPAPAPSPTSAPDIPAPTPRRKAARLTIGMTAYDDYDGVYFSVQALRMYHPEIADEVEILVIDNHPGGTSAQALKALENDAGNYRYVPSNAWSGTAVRDQLFAEAAGDFVLCIDCHVFIVPGALQRLMVYVVQNPHSRDLLQGPLLYDDLSTIATHFHPEWRGGMYGYWDKNPLAEDPQAAPFEIPMQGLGLFACRRDHWPGFNPAFRGFGGEEGYIHEKFRRAGGRTLCLPFLRWMHRFNRPNGIPYPNRWEDRIRNYLIGHRELGIPTAGLEAHFGEILGETTFRSVYARLTDELSEG